MIPPAYSARSQPPPSGSSLEITLPHPPYSLPLSKDIAGGTVQYEPERNQQGATGLKVTGNGDLPAEHELAREQHLYHYLTAIRVQGEIAPETAEAAWKMWKDCKCKLLEKTGKTLPVPDAAPGPNGELLYTWNKEEHHFELEFIAGAPMEFFYRNRNTGKFWGIEYSQGEDLPEEAIEKWSALF